MTFEILSGLVDKLERFALAMKSDKEENEDDHRTQDPGLYLYHFPSLGVRERGAKTDRLGQTARRLLWA